MPGLKISSPECGTQQVFSRSQGSKVSNVVPPGLTCTSKVMESSGAELILCSSNHASVSDIVLSTK